jgi:hypothetical protein
VNSHTFTLYTLIGLAVIGFATIPTQVRLLDAATAAQCASHDFPLEKLGASLAWCNHNGYITK